MHQQNHILDCLVIGAGPAGLTAALYLARFRRHFAIVDGGGSRAARIPLSHNLPLFERGISGEQMLRQMRQHLSHYDVEITGASVASLRKLEGNFIATLENGEVWSRHVILCTGAADVEPDLPDLPDAVQRGLIRYCPVCDGYEASFKTLGVIGFSESAAREALFIARTYSRNVILLTLGRDVELPASLENALLTFNIRVITNPLQSVVFQDASGVRVRVEDGEELHFDALYSALGLIARSDIAKKLGASHAEDGALEVDVHHETTIAGLYAAGGVVKGLDQVVIAMGHAAVAATAVHNKCRN